MLCDDIIKAFNIRMLHRQLQINNFSLKNLSAYFCQSYNFNANVPFSMCKY